MQLERKARLRASLPAWGATIALFLIWEISVHAVSYTPLRALDTVLDPEPRLLLEKKKASLYLKQKTIR